MENKPVLGIQDKEIDASKIISIDKTDIVKVKYKWKIFIF